MTSFSKIHRQKGLTDLIFCVMLAPSFVTTKVAWLECTKTRSHKGTKKEKVLDFLVFIEVRYVSSYHNFTSLKAVNRKSTYQSEIQRGDGCCEVAISADAEWAGELITERMSK